MSDSSDRGAVVTLRPRSQKKYHDDYVPADWTEFAVLNRQQIPTQPHFAGVLVGIRSQIVPYYDDYGGYNGTSNVEAPEVTYFAFPDRETMQAWVFRALKDKRHIFFFEVKKVGVAELKIDLDVGL